MNRLCVCVQVFSCLCRFVCLVSKDVSFCESLSVTEVHWMSPKCLCVLIAGDRYHQSWHHWQMNGSAVFSSCPVSLSDSHSMQQQQQQQKLLFFQLNFYHKVLHHIEVWLNVTGYQAERIFFYCHVYISIPLKKFVLGVILCSMTLHWPLPVQPLKIHFS